MQKTSASTSVSLTNLGRRQKVPFWKTFFGNTSVFALMIWFSSSPNVNQRNVLAAEAKKSRAFSS